MKLPQHQYLPLQNMQQHKHASALDCETVYATLIRPEWLKVAFSSRFSGGFTAVTCLKVTDVTVFPWG